MAEFHETSMSYEQAMLVAHGGIILLAEDIRQHAYCPRIVYFRHVMGAWPEKTYKMQRGESIHEQKARKRGVEVEGSIETYYSIWLQSTRLGFGALLDAFEFTGSEVYPVEIKTGHGPGDRGEKQFEHHVVQLVAQAMLLEEAFILPVTRARVRYIDAGTDLFIPITIDEKRALLRRLREIRDTILLENIPAPASIKGKCTDCEFWSYCLGT
ncbi:MAG: CRISPR-associated protein Cas4 [Candidatus Sigynarchaeota archaeon]